MSQKDDQMIDGCIRPYIYHWDLDCNMSGIPVVSCDMAGIPVVSYDMVEIPVVSCDMVGIPVVSCDMDGIPVVSCDMAGIAVVSCEMAGILTHGIYMVSHNFIWFSPSTRSFIYMKLSPTQHLMTIRLYVFNNSNYFCLTFGWWYLLVRRVNLSSSPSLTFV